jgi:NAD(P)-dependent dehydrogenase (short-subunit alcohol dehydrogenase family)
MIRALASLFFYTTFYSRFSAAGLERRRAQWKPYDEDLTGQTWLVTGASGGLGRAIALAANARGATVLATARSADKLDTLRHDARVPARLVPLAVDLSLVRAVRALAAEVAMRKAPVTVLVNNVGVLLNDFTRTAEGLEASFATNLLGHVVLTEALHDAGALDPAGAVINMSSGGMYGAKLDLSALARGEADGWDGMAAYAQHKRAQVELARAWNSAWKGAPKCYAMHPGWADTEGVRTSLPWFRATLKARLRTTEQGADTALWLGTTRPAIDPEGGIWLDRVRDPEHEFGFTRGGADAAALRAFLRQRAAAIG